MKRLLSFTCGLVVGSICEVISATIPTGAILTVSTLQSLSSIDVRGTPMPARLEQPVAVNEMITTYLTAVAIKR